MNKKSFHADAKRFVKKVIAIRRVIITERKNHLPQADSVIDSLENLLNYWPYNTNEKMASFIRNHREEILYLMPGKGSRSHRSLMEQYNSILERCNQVLSHGVTLC